MRQTKLFTKTRKQAPSDEVSKNAQLLIRAGYIGKERAGVYNYFPLGLRVLKNIEQLIRDEIENLGAQEILMSSLQRKELWEKTDRWDDAKVDNWFKSNLRNDSDPDGARSNEIGFAFTHEEPITNLMQQFIPSYKDLPKYVFQFQTKFRNEKRARGGLARTREFLMKDLYSFSKTENEHLDFYEKVKQVYINIFNKVGIGDKTYFTFASGGSFSKFSHEFQMVTETGEDTIYVHKDKGIAINKEVFTDDVKKDLGIEDDFKEEKSIEVGNIFTLGDKFSKTLLCSYKDENGDEQFPIMGSYGIGLGRLIAAVVEVLSDDKGIIWPESIAPYKAHLLCVSTDDDNVRKLAEDIYKELDGNILYDDRLDVRAGEKFADADLLGMPYQIIIGKKSHQESIEIKNRKTGEIETKSMTELIECFR